MHTSPPRQAPPCLTRSRAAFGDHLIQYLNDIQAAEVMAVDNDVVRSPDLWNTVKQEIDRLLQG